MSKADFLDIRNRLWQRRSAGFLQKLFKPSLQRTADTFGHNFESSAWTIIPAVRKRLNTLATGHPDKTYEEYVIDKWLARMESPSLLSIGCGVASHELTFAEKGPFSLVHGIDLAQELILSARRAAEKLGLHNTKFDVKNFLTEPFDQKYDVILFHQSLHHFENLDYILSQFLPRVLKPEGILVIHEYVGPTRLQWHAAQLSEVNRLLQKLPVAYRQIFKTPFLQKQVYRPGLLRMQASDPSESINSSEIIPALRRHLRPLDERALGGNLLHLLFKDIAHHFCNERKETKEYLKMLFDAEDQWLKSHQSDFIFGVYALPHRAKQ